MKNLVNVLTLDSREVAKMMDKAHSHLLREISTYVGYFIESNFGFNEFWQESTYKDKIGRTLKCYQITKKGCEFLAHKMTGKKGAIFTATYINRFHEMEQQLQAPKYEVSLERKTFRGVPVLTTSDMSVLLGIPHGTVLWHCQKYQIGFILLNGEKLQVYKKENKICSGFTSKLAIFTKDAVIKMLKCNNKYTKAIQKIIEAYFIDTLPKAQNVLPTVTNTPISIRTPEIIDQVQNIKGKATTIIGMLNQLLDSKREKMTHQAYAAFIAEMAMAIHVDVYKLKQNI